MAAKKSAALEFTREYLRKKPDASFSEIRDAAEAQDLRLFPIVFGRAKALEGLVKVAPYGSKKRAKARAAEAAAGDEAGAGTGLPVADNIAHAITRLREQGNQHERYRRALVEIARILDEVLE